MNSEQQEDSLSRLFKIQQAHVIQLRSEKLKERVKRLKKLQIWIEKNSHAVKQAIYKDFQKPGCEVEVTELYPALSEIKHALQHIGQWVKPQKVDAPLTLMGTTSYVQYEPKGTCLIISPWNFPFNLAVGPLISCLAAGNNAIIKPSELTPHTSTLLEAMVGELFTEQEVALFNGGVDVAERLLSLPFDHIFFTGSPTVGKIVMKSAAEHLASVTLELGGKSPCIIDKSTNLKDAAVKVAWGKFMNNGQTCVAPDYVLVHHDIARSFIDELKLAVQRLYDPDIKGFNHSDDYARIVNSKHHHRLVELLNDGVENGAKVEFGGKPNTEDNFIPPTLLSSVSPDSRLMQEEIFGPILPVITYETLDEAIATVNAKPKPLALYWFGNNKQHQNKILQQTSAGGVCINDCVIQYSNHNLPFGGVNNSGIGKAHGHHGFLAFSNEKPVMKQRVGFTSAKMVYPPYTPRVKALIKMIRKYF